MSASAWWLTGILILAVIGLIATVTALIIRTYSRQAATGKENLKGREAVVVETLKPQGTVAVEGELWNAESESGTIEVGQEVIILKVKGLTLSVSKKT